jgi:hypothetical protein
MPSKECVNIKSHKFPVMDINGFVGSLDESDLFQSYLNDKILLKDH